MSAITTNTRTQATAGMTGHGFAKFVHAVSSWFEARATRKALSQLTDRELDDIGLNRSDIQQIGIHH